MVEAILDLCLKMTKLFAREINNDNEDYASAMRYVLDPEMSFYRYFGTKDVTLSTRVINYPQPLIASFR